MKILHFSRRTAKEILRDPLNLCFGLGFPLILLFLLTAIQANIPVSLFVLDTLTPGITVFGLSFLSLFAALLVSRDRESAFLQRLYATPMDAADFIFGYTLPLLPMAAVQCAACYLAAVALGLQIGWGMVRSVIASVVLSVPYIALGLLCGSVMTSKQAGGICGSLLTNAAAFLSGIWFDVALVGGAFEAAAKALPFYHGVQLQRAVFSGRWEDCRNHFLWVAAYGAVFMVLAVWLFLRQMKKN